MNDGYYVSVLFLDLRGAFDSIDHPVLLCKLSTVGLARNELSLLTTYLCNRRQRVCLCNCLSEAWNALDTSVPQGSRIGPILFTFAVNDVHDSSHHEETTTNNADDPDIP